MEMLIVNITWLREAASNQVSFGDSTRNNERRI